MANYYVATNGNDGANGGSASPWKTISYAMQSNLRPGDVVIVRPGTYNESVTIDNGGSAAGNVTLMSEVPGAALIRPPSGAWNAIYIWDDYVTVNGFDIGGARGDGIEANNVHHIKILNNKIHGSGESGIQFNWSEFITVEGNETYENGSSGWFSGISIYQTRNITGDTTTTGYRTVVRNNVSHDNMTVDGSHTDGNGIIIEDFQSTQTGGFPNYTYPTLVDGNVAYNNGGKGIAVHWSDSVTISNNTAYHNNLDLRNPGTWRGELSNQDGKNNTWVNNIAVADPSVNSNNTAIGFYGGGNAGTKWHNNITFNGTPGQASLKLEGGSNPTPTAANGNKLGVDPLFVDPARGDFDVRSGSPAIDAGTGAFGLGAADVGGGPRVVGTVDIGAYERDAGGGTANGAPVARADSGFAAAANTPLTIAATALLANDSDPDGDALVLTGVSAPSRGTVRISGSDVVFTPERGYSGSASFSYIVSDGKGGAASATVGLTVGAPTSNAAPSFTSGATFVLDENSRAVGAVTARDAENDALTFAKAGGADAALFNIDARTGAITFANAPDFERPADADGNNVYVLGVSVTDGLHSPTATTLQITVRNVAEGAVPPPSGSSFFAPGATPTGTETGDPVDYELGMRFRPLKDGDITALRYYRGSADAGDTDVRALHLWSGNGTELAEVTMSSAPGATGWQTATLSAPVKVTAQTLYLVSYGTTQNYVNTLDYFGTALTNADGTLSVPAGSSGVFSAKTGATSGPGFFPTSSWNASNYWADVVFKAASTAPTPLNLTGTSGDDTLIGGEAADTIRGWRGNDRFQGNGGGDDMNGGGGRDVFIYARLSDSTPSAPDLIRGFVRNTDQIDLRAIDAISGGGDDAFRWIGSGGFSGSAGELRTQSTTSGLILQGDANGDRVADLAIALEASYQTMPGTDVLL